MEEVPWISLVLYGFLFFVIGIVLIASLYYLISWADLQYNYESPLEVSQQMNFCVFPETVLHIVTTVLLLLLGHYLFAILQAPVVAYTLYQYGKGRLFLDATNIMKESEISYRQKESGMKVVLYIVLFIFVIYRLTMTAIVVITKRSEEEVMDLLQNMHWMAPVEAMKQAFGMSV